MSDPQPLSFSLPDARRRLMRAVEEGTGDELDPELEAVRQAGMAEILAGKWSRTVPSRYAGATWDQVDPAVRSQLQAWASRSKPTNLVLLGPKGTGKTSAAVLALRPAFDSCLEVSFKSVPLLVEELKAAFDGGDRGTLADVCQVDRLLLDDIGKERATPWTTEQLDLIISVRYNEERPLVVTTNFNEKDLEAHIGSHAADRLLGDGADVVVMRGASRRR